MKPAPFCYSSPEEVDEALAVLAEHGEDARLLAGGQSLVPMMALRLARFDHIVDINRVEALTGIRVDDGQLVVGAAERQSTIETDRTVAHVAPVLAEATKHIGHFQIRNRGTIGGSLAHADPAAEYPAVAVALDALVDIAGANGTRTIAADELLDSAWTTTLAPDELLVAVRVPVPAERSGHAIDEVARRHGDFALAGAVGTVALAADSTIAQARIVVFGVAERPVRLRGLEQQLVGATEEQLNLGALAKEATADLSPPDDVQASSAYRKQVAGRLVESVVRQALTRARDQEER